MKHGTRKALINITGVGRLATIGDHSGSTDDSGPRGKAKDRRPGNQGTLTAT